MTDDTIQVPVDSQMRDIGPGLTLVMAAACGLAVANIYYNQPMLALMERSFPGQQSLVGFIPTATQLGYALGLLLLVPLGDLVDRRRVILIQCGLLALWLAGAALAPGAWTLVAASALVGVTASVAQQILPFAAELSAPDRRGATIGTVMSGLLLGILLSRVMAGFVGEHFGWRAMFWLGLFLSLATAGLLAAKLPHSRPSSRLGYPALLRSLATLWRREPTLRRATLIQACVFGSFSALWTILALHLDRDYHLSATVAGAFGFVGAAGVLFAPLAGRIADRRGPQFVVGMTALVMVASWAILGICSSMVGMVAGVILLDFGAQGAQVSNQHVIHGLAPQMRNRLNAILMGGMFIGGAIGSTGASIAWKMGGWSVLCGFGAVLALVGFVVHLLGQNANPVKHARKGATG